MDDEVRGIFADGQPSAIVMDAENLENLAALGYLDD